MGWNDFQRGPGLCFFTFFHLKVFLFPGLLGLVSIFFSFSYSFLMSSQLLPPRFNLPSHLPSLLLCSIFPRDISSRFYDKEKQGPGAKKEKEKN